MATSDDQPDWHEGENGRSAPTVFLVHAAISESDLAAVAGVDDHQALGRDLFLVSTTSSRSRLYHDVKWAGLAEAPILVVELTTRPKAAHLYPGSVGWIRDHLEDR